LIIKISLINAGLSSINPRSLNYYTDVIESHEKTVDRVLAEISDSPENYDGTIELIANGIVFDPWVG
jgi:hypothetical protein